MFERIINGITPYAMGILVLAGLSLVGIVHFSGYERFVGLAVVLIGILLSAFDIYKKCKTPTKK